MLRPVEKQLATVSEALDQLGTCCGEISEQRATIEANIHTTVGQLQDILENRRTKLINLLDQITQCKLKSLAVQKDQLEATQVQLRSCLDFAKKSMQTDILQDIVQTKTSIAKQVEEQTAPLPPDFLKPCSDAKPFIHHIFKIYRSMSRLRTDNSTNFTRSL